LLVNRPVPELSEELLGDTRRLIARRAAPKSKSGAVSRWIPLAGVASAASLATAVLVVALVGLGSAQPSQPAFADRLPEFSLASLAGEPTSISRWSGRPLLINFWATWCAPCRREIPLLKEFQSDNPAVQVIGIAVDNFDMVEAFDAEMQFNYPIMIGGDDAIEAAAAFGVEAFAIPFTVLVTSDGYLLGIHKGEADAALLTSFAGVIDDVEADRIDVEAARAVLAAESPQIR
jgi:thiol-disulfide isomerase/thioredoxin